MLQRLISIPWRAIPAWLIGNRLHILMYHSISENPLDPHAISQEEFHHQMNGLQTKKVIGLREALDHLHSYHGLKDLYVITFDDALLDFYTTALPVLKEFAFPVSMFVPTGMLGENAVWDSFDKSKPLMTWEQLKECQTWNVSFGSHTVHHAVLTECDDERLREELSDSLQTLRDRLENAFPALAYPGGIYDERVRQAARDAGYTCALGVASRWGNGSESDLFQLRRQRIQS